jgi:EAL domain-containing protein (putative c-di-GMP-specific phosphodiesterase class I)
MSDSASVAKIIDELRRHGIRIALDDFGTGQSSLSRLREFPFDKLKIDRAFVSSMLKDRPSQHIIRAILSMCDGLGIHVVAEGIEEEEQAECLLELGCQAGQGFLFGKPVDASSTLALLRGLMRNIPQSAAI